ncbi:MAG: hypothetical protein P8177_01160 [Gemmatimonadota bacterium]|jgi:hypothetical protein
MIAPTVRILCTAAILAAGAAAALPAQTAIVDEGSFRLSVRGTPVGTETFRIQRSGSGENASLIAQGRIVLDSGEQTRALLQVEGPGLRPAGYQIEVTGPQPQKITGQATGSRFRATIVSNSGEQMREYLASDGAVVLDDGVAHQHYFLAALDGDGRVPVIIPRQSRQVSAEVSTVGRDQITVAGESVSARRIRVAPQGLSERSVWVDDQNRVLRLEIPADNFVAERTALP